MLRYSPALHAARTIDRFADAYMESLEVLVRHCLDPQAGGYTPSDFALADLDQKRLDALLAQVNRRKGQ
jgi:non-ribosomal peptide synthase protein (TIGR01720 family)